MIEGIIIKGYSGFYYVKNQEKLWECSLRGKYRIKDQNFLPGDKVRISPIKEDKAVIEEVLPRENELVRPPIANVEQVMIISAAKNPDPDSQLIDRLTVLALWNNIKPIICFNKIDLIDELEITRISEPYIKAGFHVLQCSVKNEKGIDELRAKLAEKTSVFAGLSGVGKSSLLNSVDQRLTLKTGEISTKLRRGKHTTRHVELLELENGGLVADTPGFSSLDLPQMLREDLMYLFPEFENYRTSCRFNTCLHWHEPQCAVKEALDEGEISKQRYDNYLTFLQEVISKERRY